MFSKNQINIHWLIRLRFYISVFWVNRNKWFFTRIIIQHFVRCVILWKNITLFFKANRYWNMLMNKLLIQDFVIEPCKSWTDDAFSFYFLQKSSRNSIFIFLIWHLRIVLSKLIEESSNDDHQKIRILSKYYFDYANYFSPVCECHQMF